MTTNTARFWDRIAERYARKPVPDEAIYRRKLDVTRRYMDRQSRVLEIGCGTGSTAIEHAPNVREVSAVDVSNNMLDIAREKARKAGIDNISFRCQAIEQVDFATPKPDVILALSVLHLLEDWQAVIGRIHDALPPGGIFVSSTACIADGMKWFKLVGPIGAALGLIPKVLVFSGEELETCIENTGFVIEESWRPGPRKGLFVVARKPLSS